MSIHSACGLRGRNLSDGNRRCRLHDFYETQKGEYTRMSYVLDWQLTMWTTQDRSYLHISLLCGGNIESFPCLDNDPIRSSLRVSPLISKYRTLINSPQRKLTPNRLHRNTSPAPHLPDFCEIRYVHAPVHHELYARRNISGHGYHSMA
jgi:hypothetical protein